MSPRAAGGGHIMHPLPRPSLQPAQEAEPEHLSSADPGGSGRGGHGA